MRCAPLRRLLITLCFLAGAPPANAEPKPELPSPPQIQEEIWGLPFELPTLAYVVRPVGNGPFPLVVMNHGVSLGAKARSFFPLVEFRDAAVWFARQGYMVVAPVFNTAAVATTLTIARPARTMSCLAFMIGSLP